MSKEAAAPILRLFRTIMRTHRDKLAGPLKELGNDYVRSEFRSHLRNAKVTREQWQQFDQQWRNYLSFIGGTADAKAPIFDGSGELKPDVLEVMSEDQRKRVQQLKDAASKLGQPDG